MALIECPNCGHPVSDKATKCPNCSTELNFDEILFCKECGVKIHSGSDVCSNCGCPVENRKPLSSISAEKATTKSEKIPITHNQKVYNRMCLAGFIFGLFSILFYWIFAIIPILAIIFSFLGIKDFDNKNNIEKGEGFGYVGLALGIVYVLVYLFYTM